MRDLITTFGRPAPATLGAPDVTATPAAVPSCAFTHFLGDEDPHVPGKGISNGEVTALVAAGLVGVGWLLGGIVPVIGRPVGSLVGAGIAGASTYANFTLWKTQGGTSKKPGACR